MEPDYSNYRLIKVNEMEFRIFSVASTLYNKIKRFRNIFVTILEYFLGQNYYFGSIWQRTAPIPCENSWQDNFTCDRIVIFDNRSRTRFIAYIETTSLLLISSQWTLVCTVSVRVSQKSSVHYPHRDCTSIPFYIWLLRQRYYVPHRNSRVSLFSLDWMKTRWY